MRPEAEVEVLAVLEDALLAVVDASLRLHKRERLRERTEDGVRALKVRSIEVDGWVEVQTKLHLHICKDVLAQVHAQQVVPAGASFHALRHVGKTVVHLVVRQVARFRLHVANVTLQHTQRRRDAVACIDAHVHVVVRQTRTNCEFLLRGAVQLVRAFAVCACACIVIIGGEWIVAIRLSVKRADPECKPDENQPFGLKAECHDKVCLMR